MTVQEIYNRTIKGLPESDRVQLATLILSGMSFSGPVDYKDSWSEEDIADASRYSLHRGDRRRGC